LKRTAVCYWCGGESATTKDDVFPQTLVLGDKPNAWLRVPAHKTCNESLQLDEQYFRFVVLLGGNYLDPDARLLWDKKMRPYLRRSPRFAQRLFESLQPVEVKAEDGVVLGTAHAHQVDQPRVNRVLEKIVRGLYYSEHKGPLGAAAVKARLYHLATEVPEEVKAIITQVPARSVGPHIRYRYAYAKEEPRWSFTLMRFYKSGLYLVETKPSEPRLLS
jgi:hypothetical protein